MYVDHGFTGKTMTRSGLAHALKALRAGDELVVPAMDRLARNARDTLRVVDELTATGVRLNIGGTVYEPDSPMSRLFLTILAAVAEAEGGWISARTKEAMARPEVRAKLKGKRTRMTSKNDETIVWQHEHGMTIAELAARFNTSRPSIYRAIERRHARHPQEEVTPPRRTRGDDSPQTTARPDTVRSDDESDVSGARRRVAGWPRQAAR